MSAAAAQRAVPQLQLQHEAKLVELLGEQVDRHLEASGVLAKDGLFYVIFDNAPHIGRLGAGLSPAAKENRLIRPEQRHGAGFRPKPGHRSGFEDIAYDRSTNRFYVLIEALPFGGGFMAAVEEYDERLRHVASGWLDFPLDRPNKGLEGLTCIRRDGQTYLLGLCEGNRCKAGAAGRRPGGGRIQRFGKGAHRWEHVGEIRLPTTLWFEDYSSLAVAGDRIAVVSQASSALWVGSFVPSGWELADDGATYRFPPDGDGRTVYCNVEGVSWVAPDRVVVVSDRAKATTQDERCRAKDQSIHVFAIPQPAQAGRQAAESAAAGQAAP